jgi:putative spermidine/putrescine transport system permease protein
MLQGKILTSFVVVIFAGLLAPLVAVLGVSFSPSEQFAITWAQPSLRWYIAFFQRRVFYDALFFVSFPIALISAFLATLLGGLASIAFVRLTFPGKKLLETAAMLPLIIPSILLGAALYLFLTRLNVSGTLASLLIGHVLLGIPFVIRALTAGLSGIDRSLEEAAMNLGCNRPKAFVKVVLPLIRGSVLSGWLFAFITSFSDINVALFLSGPNTQTVPLQIFSEIRWGGDPTIAAASGVQIIVVGGLVLVAQRIFGVRLAFK